MKKALTVINRLLHPPKWVLLFFPPVVFAALIHIFVRGEEKSIPAYLIYGMSAYCLTVLVIPIPGLFRRIKAFGIKRMTGTTFGRKYIGDPAFRGSVGIYQGMTANFLYVVFRILVGIRYGSVWFISMAVYYLILGIMRLSLVVSYRHREESSELRCYRRTAWLLFLLNIPMGGMITLMVFTDSGYSYPGYVIYLSAMYTFYTMILSIVNLVKFHKIGSLILSASKALNFIAALMSMIGLQTAMIAQFSTNGERFRRMMNALTGGGIWLTVILTAVYMLLHSTKMKNEVKPIEPLRK